MKNKINKILLIMSSVLIILILLLGILGSIERIGYLSDFKLISSKNGNYTYDFRISYYNKVFRNSDLYYVYPNIAKIKKDNEFIKDIKMNEKGGPFGTLVSSQKISNNINNVFYKLSIKGSIYYCFILFITIIFIIKYHNQIKQNFNVKSIALLLYSNNKKYAIILSIIFLLVMSFSEIKLFNNETSLEFDRRNNTIVHPHYYRPTSVFFNRTYLENTNNYPDRLPINSKKREIKDKYRLYFYLLADNHVTGNIYGALKTGKNLKELRSHNFWLFTGNGKKFATEQDFNRPTLYSSKTLLTAKIIYLLMPIKYIGSYETELKAADHMKNIRILLILLHIFMWTILIYIISIKFNFLYALILSFSVLAFPGLFLQLPAFYFTSIIIPLFPIYILAFYKYDLNIKNKIIFFIGLFLLIFIQWYLDHYHSVAFQLPIMLLTLAFVNFHYQLKSKDINNYKDIFTIILEHIKKYTLQYTLIILYTILITFIVLFLSYKEQITLQPENKEVINQNMFERSKGYARKYSLVLVTNTKINPEFFYVDYSLENRINHNKILFNKYFNYPSIYPLWRLESFISKSLNNFLYNNLPILYIPFYILFILSIILNIIIIFKNKQGFKLLIPLLFILACFIWYMIFVNAMARVASHWFTYPHILLQYFTSIILIYITYLVNIILKKDKLIDNKENI